MWTEQWGVWLLLPAHVGQGQEGTALVMHTNLVCFGPLAHDKAQPPRTQVTATGAYTAPAPAGA